MTKTKYLRVIHHLSDGRRKYSSHRGEIEQWSAKEVENLKQNIEFVGMAAYTLDFSKYDTSWRVLRQRFPKARIVKVVGFTVEDYDLPIDEKIIY